MPDDPRGSPGESPAERRGDDVLRPPRVRFIGETYRLLFEKNPLPMWVYDIKSLYFLAVNDAAVAHYGYSRNEFLRMTIRDIQPAEDAAALMRGLEGVDATTQTFGLWRHLTRSGGVIDVEVLSNEIDFEGHRARIVLAHDITERQRVERRLRTGFAVTRVLTESATFREATPRLLRAICEEADWEYGELWLVSRDGASLRWSGAWHIDGLPAAEFEETSRGVKAPRGTGIPGRTWATGRPEWLTELTPQVQFERARAAEGIGLRQGMSFPVVGRDRKVLGVMAFFSRTVREPDEPFLELMSDLGERAGLFLEGQRNEEERRKAEERFAKAFRENPNPSAIARLADSVILDVNESFLRMFEVGREEVVGLPSRDLVLDSNLPDRDRILEAVRRGESVRGAEGAFRTRSGRSWSALLFAEPLSLADEPTVLLTLVDITQREETQRGLVESERLASIGRTAAYVAHQLNTPLANMSLLTESVRRRTQDPEALDRLEKLDAQRRLAAEIIHGLLDLTRSQDIETEETDLTRLIAQAADQTAAFRKHDVALNLDLGSGPAVVAADPLKLSQAFTNLLKNAYQATDAGSVTVSLRREADGIRVVVRDTGKGMTSEERTRIFEPFFTTKPTGEGIGLGLLFAKAVVEAHAGRIDVDSEPGRGTTVTVDLPGARPTA